MKDKKPPQTKEAPPLDRIRTPSRAEAAMAQKLLDHRATRIKPPKVKFERDKKAVSNSFEGDDQKAGMLAMHSATGLKNAASVDLMLVLLCRLAGGDLETLSPTVANHAIALLDELAPTDGAEGILAAQMVAAHLAAMDCYSRAALPNQSLAARELNLKHAGKLSRIYAEQVTALDRHRRNGQQTVVVEHVHVHDGGQAIVGSVSPPAPAQQKF